MTRLLTTIMLRAAAALAFAQIANAQCPTTQSCITVHAQPGCDSAECCLAVCNLDPTCCINDWDTNCVLFANNACVGYCGAEASGNCFAAHANPACNNSACCTAVCALDPFCCTTSWDTNCAIFAGFACPGNPGTCGVTPDSCFEPHPQGACNNTECCNAVCTIDPACCEQSWDQICVYTAEQVCVFGCTPTLEKNASQEIEACDTRTNDPCYNAPGGSPEIAVPNLQFTGTLGRPVASTNGPDVDVYRIEIPDTNGDGQARVTLSFVSSPAAWVLLVPDSACAPVASNLIRLSSSLCVDTASEPICVPAGFYRVVVAAGNYPNYGGGDIPCTFGNRYGFKVTVTQNCNACSPTSGPCFVPHAEGGCNTPACCTSVCAADPFCCQTTWDTDCVALAVANCIVSPPANDGCAGAIPVTLGERTFNTGKAGTELAQPAGCNASFARDIWFSYESDRTGIIDVQTCGSWFDTVLAVYGGTCKAPTLISCNDDGQICAGVGASRLSLDVQCGQRYLIRVGPKSGQGGEATLRILPGQSVECAAPCPEDLNGSGTVDAQDIAALLNGWGAASGDVNGDGTTDAQDIAALLNAWGTCP